MKPPKNSRAIVALKGRQWRFRINAFPVASHLFAPEIPLDFRYGPLTRIEVEMGTLFFPTPNINVSAISFIKLNPESGLTIGCLHTDRVSGNSAEFSDCCPLGHKPSFVKP